MPSLPLSFIVSLALSNAPQVAPETLVAFAQAESRLSPLAIHDNATGRSYAPAAVSEAVRLATRLLADGSTVDLGLMQINSQNLSDTGLTVETAFYPAESIRAGDFILVEAYRLCDGQPKRLRCMASRYNTGSSQRGIRNGYADRVWNAAEMIVPAIKQAPPPPSPPPNSCGQPPPAWDGYAVAAYELCLRHPPAQDQSK